MRESNAFRKSIETMCLSLLQETILLHWRAPIVKSYAGQTRLNGNGVINIYIDPAQSNEHIYLTALHEIGHCLAGHMGNLPKADIPRAIEDLYLSEGPILEMTQEQQMEYVSSPMELEANQIANHLNNLAKRLALQRFGRDEIEYRITVLIEQVQYMRQE